MLCDCFAERTSRKDRKDKNKKKDGGRWEMSLPLPLHMQSSPSSSPPRSSSSSLSEKEILLLRLCDPQQQQRRKHWLRCCPYGYQFHHNNSSEEHHRGGGCPEKRHDDQQNRSYNTCQHEQKQQQQQQQEQQQQERQSKRRHRRLRRRGKIRLSYSSPSTTTTTIRTKKRWMSSTTISLFPSTCLISTATFMMMLMTMYSILIVVFCCIMRDLAVVDGWTVVPKVRSTRRRPTASACSSSSSSRIDGVLQQLQEQASILRSGAKQKHQQQQQQRHGILMTATSSHDGYNQLQPNTNEKQQRQRRKQQSQHYHQQHQSMLLECTTRTELEMKLYEILSAASNNNDNSNLHDSLLLVLDHYRRSHRTVVSYISDDDDDDDVSSSFNNIDIFNVTTTAFRRLANIVYLDSKEQHHHHQRKHRHQYQSKDGSSSSDRTGSISSSSGNSSSSSSDKSSSTLLPILMQIIATRIAYQAKEDRMLLEQEHDRHGRRTVATMNNNQNDGGTTSCIRRRTDTIHPVCLSDTLQALSLLSRINVAGDMNSDSVYNNHRHDHYHNRSSSQATTSLFQKPRPVPRTSNRAMYFRPLGCMITEVFNNMPPGDIYRIGPTRLVQTIQSMNELGLFERDGAHDAHDTTTTTEAATNSPPTVLSTDKILSTILQRLIKPDAISKLPPKMVVHCLLTLLDIHQSVVATQPVHDYCDGDGETEIGATAIENEAEAMVLGLIQSLMRRLIRNPKVRREIPLSDLCRIFTAIQRFERQYVNSHNILQEEKETEEVEDDNNNIKAHSFHIKRETDKFVDSILKSILAAKHYQSPVDKVDEDTNISKINAPSYSTATATEKTTIAQWTPVQFSTLLSSWLNISPDSRSMATLGGLLDICMEEKIVEKCSFWKLSDLALMLTSGGQYDDAESRKAITELIVIEHSDFILGMEDQFQKLVTADRSNGYSNIPTDEAICKFLRWYVVVQRRQRQEGDRQNSSLIQAADTLFSDRHYISNCKMDHLNTFLWFLGAASTPPPPSVDAPGDKIREETILSIADRLVDIESFDSSSCTPGLSSDTLAGFTSAVANCPSLSKSELIHHASLQIFDSFGPILLLSRSLSPGEASKALRAYADAVTFRYEDHKGIIDHLVGILASSPVSKKCTTRQLSESLWACGKLLVWESNKNPPYIEHALVLADELASRTEEMTSEDSAQAIWALGKLKVREKELVSVLASRTIHPDLQPGFAEISNILWGMCQVQFRDVRIIYALVERTKVLIGTDHSIKSKEASSILYCLANLGFRDEQVFESLANQIVEQIDSTSAQSVANTLYAFRTVQLRPPTEILNSWAKENLGIIPLTGIANEQHMSSDPAP